MGITEELKIKITGDATGANNAFKSIGTSLQNMGPKIAAFGKMAIAALAVAATAAAAAIGTVLVKTFETWQENQLIQTKLNNTLKNTGKITGVTAALVNKLGKELQKTTRFEDDAVAAGGEILARFKNINSNIFPETIQLTADLAESLGVDFPEAAKMMGKALSTPGEGLRVLKQAGVDLGDDVLKSIDRLLASGKLEEAQKLILSALQGSIGGVSVAAGQTSSGLMDNIKNQVGGIFDGLAESLGPGFDKILSFISVSLGQFTSDPQTIMFIDNLGVQFSNMARDLPTVVGNIRQLMGILSMPPSAGPSALFEQIGKLSQGWMDSKLVSQMITDLTNVGAAFANVYLWADKVGIVIKTQLPTAFSNFIKSKLITQMTDAFNGIGDALRGIYNWATAAIAKIQEFAKVKLGMFQPGSPTPFEIGLRGINSELDTLTKKTIPNITGGVSFSTGGANNGAATEMAGIRDEIRFMVRTLPRAIANANA
jgi:hypothetical protein